MDIEQTIQHIMEEKKISREKIKTLIEEQIEELSGLIDEEGAIVIVAKNLGVDLQSHQQASAMEQDQSIGKLTLKMNASVVGRIINIEDIRKFNKKDGSEGILLSFIIQDTTGMVKVLAWGPHHAKMAESPQFATNEIIRIVNGFVKSGRTGQLELHVGDRSAIQLQPDQVDRTLIPDTSKADAEVATNISDLSLKQPFFNVEGQLGPVYPPKPFTRKDGSQGQRASISVTDSTGTTYLTFWGDHCQKMADLKQGQKVVFTKLSPKQNYRDPNKIDLTASSATSVIVKDATSTVSQSTSTVDNQTIVSIKSIIQSGGFGNIEGQIQSIEEKKTVSLRDGSKKDLLKFVLADETGAIRLTLWGDQIKPELQPGQSWHLTGVGVKENSFSKQMEGNLTRNGAMEQITKQFSTTHTIEPIAKNFTDDIKDRVSIDEIQKDGYISFKGSVIREINRVTTYRACSQCNRKIDNCNCPTPGTTVNRMILNLLLDDGKGTIRGSLMGDTAEQFIGESTDKIATLNENGEIEQFLQGKNRDLLGTDYIFRGKARFSDYSDSYEVNINKFHLLDPAQEAKELIELVQKK